MRIDVRKGGEEKAHTKPDETESTSECNTHTKYPELIKVVCKIHRTS